MPKPNESLEGLQSPVLLDVLSRMLSQIRDEIKGIDFSSVTSSTHTHQSSGAQGGLLDHGVAMTAASLLDDDHTQYRLETADHNHQSTGLQAGTLDHGLALTGLTDDDHTQYLKEEANGGLASEIPDHTHASAAEAGTIAHNALTGLTNDDHTQYRLESADHNHQSTGLQAGTLDHGLALTGLGDDDHTQYTLLAGRSGGQTLVGGTAAADALTLQSTGGIGTTDHIKFLVGNNGAKEALRVVTGGEVGVGTTTPASFGRFVVVGTGGENVFISQAGADSATMFSGRNSSNVGIFDLDQMTGGHGRFRVLAGAGTFRHNFLTGSDFARYFQDESSSDPSTSDLAANAQITIYNKNNKFVIAYNNAGTVTYLSIALDGSATTWIHNTTAP